MTFDEFQKTLNRLVFIKEAKNVRITTAQGRNRQLTPRLNGKVLTAGNGTGSSENNKETNKRPDTHKTAKASHAGRPQYYNYQGYGHITRHCVKARVTAARVTEPPPGENQGGKADNKTGSEN